MKRQKGRLANKIIGILMIVSMIGVAPWFWQGMNSYGSVADNTMKATSIGAEAGYQGEKNISIQFEIENGFADSKNLTNIKFSTTSGDMTLSAAPSSLTVSGKGKAVISIMASLGRNADTGSHTVKFTAEYPLAGGGTGNLEGSTDFDIYKQTASSGDIKSVAGLDITASFDPGDGFSVGHDNVMKLTVYNYGTTVVNDLKAVLTLPEKLSVYNGSNTEAMGYLSTGKRGSTEFTINVMDSAESKVYPIEVEMTGKDRTSSAVSVKKTFYVQVNGKGAINSESLSIENVNAPEEVKAGENFSLSFSVVNNSNREIKDLKVTVEPSEGLLNRSRNIFIENIGKNSRKDHTVKFTTFSGGDKKSYSVKITAAPAADSGGTGVSQYATVTVLSDGADTKKPQLMIDKYTYGGSVVQAGNDFNLNLSLFNTSGKELKNVKVSLDDADNVFIPIQGSNSFFVEKIQPKGHYTRSITLTTKKQAEQKITALKVNMTYEDGAGGTYEASDVISIPVTQKTRLVIDEIVEPVEVYVGVPGSCSVNFYNMGKTTISNVRANCEGNFTVAESNSYYAGNMESGKSDSYRFSFIPKEAGEMTGTVSFTFENADGETELIEIPFKFTAEEMFEEDPMMGDMEPEKKTPWALIIFGAVVAGGIIGLIIFKKVKKSKMNKALEIDDFDIDDKNA